MFLLMYGLSLMRSFGVTLKRWTAAGQMPPATIDVRISSPIPPMGSSQFLKRAFTKNSTLITIAMIINSLRAGSCA